MVLNRCVTHVCGYQSLDSRPWTVQDQIWRSAMQRSGHKQRLKFCGPRGNFQLLKAGVHVGLEGLGAASTSAARNGAACSNCSKQWVHVGETLQMKRLGPIQPDQSWHAGAVKLYNRHIRFDKLLVANANLAARRNVDREPVQLRLLQMTCSMKCQNTNYYEISNTHMHMRVHVGLN